MNDQPNELWQWTAADLALAIRKKRVSSLEAVESCFARIDAVNPRVNALVSVQRDDAMRAAEAADRALASGEATGVLHGVPVTTKVNVDQKGLPTTNGVVAFADNVASSDSPVVRNLRNAGAVLIGRSNAPAFSLRWYTDNDLHGRTLNPWRADRTPGGSSGGAAVAVALGMCPIGHGTDGGGSIRYPAFCTGTVGLRPSWGRIPSFNETVPVERPLSMQLVVVQGAITRSVEDARVALTAMLAGDARDPWWVPAPLEWPPAHAPLRVAVCIDPAEVGVHPAVEAQILAASKMLEEAGYLVETAAPPDVGAAAAAWNEFVQGEGILTAGSHVARYGDSDAKRAFELMVQRTPRNDTAAHIRVAASRATYLRKWQAFMERYPLVLCPVAMEPALPYGVDTESAGSVERLFRSHTFLLATSLIGLPSISVPCGIADGVPVGVQIVGQRFREDLVLGAAQCIEDRAGRLVPPEPVL